MVSIWPSLIWIALTMFGVGLQVEKETFGWSGFAATILITSLLWWGGFFEPLANKLL